MSAQGANVRKRSLLCWIGLKVLAVPAQTVAELDVPHPLPVAALVLQGIDSKAMNVPGVYATV